MTNAELLNIEVEKYDSLKRIKEANGKQENEELDYQMKISSEKILIYKGLRKGIVS